MNVSNHTLIPHPFPPNAPLDRDSTLVLRAEQLYKGFTLHHQGGIRLPVLAGVSLELQAGECVALAGASGAGKSTLIRSLYGNYRTDRGAIWVKHLGQWVNLPQLEPHELLEVRKKTIGYISQFLRVIPRVPALEVAAEPLLELGTAPKIAYEIVRGLFIRLNLPERLWSLSPTTFSGGEKQRVNIARAWSVPYPILLLDEPTSALDATNREVVMQLIEERKAEGCAMIGIFHDDEVRSRVCNRRLTLGQDD
ncbi:phosphonate C-P lyase system protein PhnL [Leptolyngbya sp. FACHB-711]|uniref:phosphonate C-P lyase system protein PhnL n=1 Tax=unclassified Leptolyngbya TaxID=2650499 RepID=UPI001685328C|nr:phosphonate C-P lyase system protein PhnL [Leptolyngbya sp. FACHB-711]MBD1848953.1 phosphonate C-P lyase system protein PhnL [Cyanobacteria bacterium FACHB-502]MBD2027502.1 phosphonate C-P lyase system protein PhnL [Leptolyngbya sp. FACHB-711]